MRSLVSWSPWSDFERMWNAMERVAPARQAQDSGLFVPMDIYEQEGKILVRCSVPGVKPEDLSLTVDQGMLTLSGETKNEHEAKEGNRVYHREHTYGKFTRSVRLPEDVDENSIEANFEHGVVTVSIARQVQPEPKPKQIEIRSAGTTENRKSLQRENTASKNSQVDQQPEKVTVN